MDAAASRFLARVGHWSQARWSQPARSAPPAPPDAPQDKISDLGELPPPEGPELAKIADHGRARSRAEVVHALVQRLADLGALVEGRPARSVPRLENDLALPDQVRVLVADLRRAAAPVDALRAAAADLDATAARL